MASPTKHLTPGCVLDTTTMANVAETITVSNSGYSLPVEDLLTGRGAIFGKSGSGKSNTATVVAEELLTEGLPMMIVDQDGEYYGLRDEFDMLHVGANDKCDRIIGSEDAEHVADIALEDNTPVILDVSGYVEEEVAREIVELVIRRLFQRENDLMKPFLLLVEEIHEYIPEQGGHDDLGDMLIRVAKRGRKRGLGICGISQRPASVSKDFITQCDWLVWHRLTWDNDTKVVGRILGSEYSDRVTELRDGEAYVMTDWDEEVRRIRFRLKRTDSGGGTPGLENLSGVGGPPSNSSGTENPSPDPDEAGVADVDADESEPVDPAAVPNEPVPVDDSPGVQTLPEPAPDGADDAQETGVDRRKALEAARSESNGPSGTASAGQSKPGAPQRLESHEGNVLWEFSQMMVYLLSLMGYNLGRAVRSLVSLVTAAFSAVASAFGALAALPRALNSQLTGDETATSADAGQRQADPSDPLATPTDPGSNGDGWDDDPRTEQLAHLEQDDSEDEAPPQNRQSWDGVDFGQPGRTNGSERETETETGTGDTDPHEDAPRPDDGDLELEASATTDAVGMSSPVDDDRATEVDDDRVTEILDTHGLSDRARNDGSTAQRSDGLDARQNVAPDANGDDASESAPAADGFDHAESERFARTGQLNWVRFSMVLVAVIVAVLVALGYVLFLG